MRFKFLFLLLLLYPINTSEARETKWLPGFWHYAMPVKMQMILELCKYV